MTGKAKEKDDDGNMSRILGKILDAAEKLGDTFEDKMGKAFVSSVGKTMDQFYDGIYRAERNVFRIMFSALLFIAGLLFVAVSLIFIVPQYVNISLEWSLLVIGIVLILISWLAKYRIEIEAR